MKKLATLILAAGLVFGATTGANAIDFKAKGQWIMSFDYGMNGNFMGNYRNSTATGWGKGGQDEFEARQRIRLQLDAVASESLSGTVYFEIGDTIWGKAADGGALGADGKIVEVKNAYIDWMVPETDVKVRMGLQHVALPSFTLGSSTVMDDDVAGITVNYAVNENVGLTALWMRPFNDNFGGLDNYHNNGVNGWRNGYMDNMDAFALLVPLTFDGVKVTPWAMYAAVGPNTFRRTQPAFGTPGYRWYSNLSNTAPSGSADGYAQRGLFPVAGAHHKDFSPASNAVNGYADAIWAGITGDLTMWDPLRIAFDFTYGGVFWDTNGRLNRTGWLASLLFEYKLDWAIPGIYGWYGSGDDSNPANGSERMPTISANNTNDFSRFAFNGDPYIARDGVISDGNMGGTWGIGIRLKDMSFVENLKHTFRINYIGGTNSPSMAKKMSLNGLWANGYELSSGTRGIGAYSGTVSPAVGMDAMYLTTQDSALEFGLTNTYKMYENFTINVEADYIAMFLDTDKSVWGARHRLNQSIPSTRDAWNINASFVYQF